MAFSLETTVSRVFVLRKHEGADFRVRKAGFVMALITFTALGRGFAVSALPYATKEL
jgi:hypothetical protein